jgi:hypothetical protein
MPRAAVQWQQLEEHLPMEFQFLQAQQPQLVMSMQSIMQQLHQVRKRPSLVRIAHLACHWYHCRKMYMDSFIKVLIVERRTKLL